VQTTLLLTGQSIIFEDVVPVGADGSISLLARAWAVRSIR
jgi:hypothetical protein